MLVSIIFYSNVIIFCTDIIYLAKLRNDTKKEVIKILRENDYHISLESEDKVFYELDCYLSRKYYNYQDLNSLRMSSAFPISNLLVLSDILKKNIKRQYEIIPTHALDEEFISDYCLIKDTSKEQEKNKNQSDELNKDIISLKEDSYIPTNDKVKKKVLKK